MDRLTAFDTFGVRTPQRTGVQTLLAVPESVENPDSASDPVERAEMAPQNLQEVIRRPELPPEGFRRLRQMNGSVLAMNGISQGDTPCVQSSPNRLESSKSRKPPTDLETKLSTGWGDVKPAFSTVSTDSARERPPALRARPPGARRHPRTALGAGSSKHALSSLTPRKARLYNRRALLREPPGRRSEELCPRERTSPTPGGVRRRTASVHVWPPAAAARSWPLVDARGAHA